MGILNMTPDSFSGDGLLQSDRDPTDAAMAQAQRFVLEGAHILDIGGESTRPGATLVSEEEEIRRVIPVVRAVASSCCVPISVDTTKAAVAEAALQEGAHMINDVGGLHRDPRIGELVAAHRAWIVLMHNWTKGQLSSSSQLGACYVDVHCDQLIEEVMHDLRASIALAHAAGIKDDRILLDPGIGFGKTVQQNLFLIQHLGRIKAMGYPVLLGVSRKSFIGYTLACAPQDRLEGTSASVAIGIAHGADIVRVHDVSSIARVARMTDALVRMSSSIS